MDGENPQERIMTPEVWAAAVHEHANNVWNRVNQSGMSEALNPTLYIDLATDAMLAGAALHAANLARKNPDAVDRSRLVDPAVYIPNLF